MLKSMDSIRWSICTLDTSLLTSIFLDWSTTFWAVLCVAIQPVKSLTIILTLLLPSCEHVASCWRVGIFCACKAKDLPASTFNFERSCVRYINSYTSATAWSRWTPLIMSNGYFREVLLTQTHIPLQICYLRHMIQWTFFRIFASSHQKQI